MGVVDFVLVEEDEEVGLLVFLILERVKVVVMVVIVMVLCNVDCVVLFVVIVFMFVVYGWS